MSLIILLILSEDDYFNRAIHEIKLKKPTWYDPTLTLSFTPLLPGTRNDR